MSLRRLQWDISYCYLRIMNKWIEYFVYRIENWSRESFSLNWIIVFYVRAYNSNTIKSNTWKWNFFYKFTSCALSISQSESELSLFVLSSNVFFFHFLPISIKRRNFHKFLKDLMTNIPYIFPQMIKSSIHILNAGLQKTKNADSHFQAFKAELWWAF